MKGNFRPSKSYRIHVPLCCRVVRENEKSPIWVRESSNSSDNEDEDLFPSSGLLDPPTLVILYFSLHKTNFFFPHSCRK